MEHVQLGRTGLPVSRLCLGTMTFGLQCDEPTSFAILDAAAEAGITFLDTADMYPVGGTLETVGRTEEIVGRWLKGRRDDFVVATKCFGVMGPQPWQRGSSRKHVREAVEASLRRLGLERIDLYQLHGPDPATPIDETLGVLDDLVREGKVAYVGCSNFAAWQVALAVGKADAAGLERFASVQPRYNLLYRRNELELFPLCAQEGVAVIPYNPLAGGLLTGKHRPGPATEGTRFTVGTSGPIYQERYWNDRAFATVEALQAVAQDAGVSLVTLAVAWVLAQPAVTSPIIGASRPEQLTESVAALDVVIDEELRARIDDLTSDYLGATQLR